MALIAEVVFPTTIRSRPRWLLFKGMSLLFKYAILTFFDYCNALVYLENDLKVKKRTTPGKTTSAISAYHH
jgi:hypothetical protein